jgi:hypothetical protein
MLKCHKCKLTIYLFLFWKFGNDLYICDGLISKLTLVCF